MENKRKDGRKIQVIVTIMLLVAAAGLLWAARAVNGFAEWYSRTVYPVLVSVIGRFWGMAPVSVVERLLYGGIVLLLFWLVRDFRRPLRLVLNYGTAVTVLLFLYAACCGVNYYRVPFSSYYIAEMNARAGENAEAETESARNGNFAEREQEDYLEQRAGESTEQRNGANAGQTTESAGIIKESDPNRTLKELCLWLTAEVNQARIEMDKAEGNYENVQKKGVAAMKRLAEQYPALDGFYPQPKPVAVSWILSIQQCSGVYSPFTIEANYNNDMTPYNIPHTICHELSHLRGFMREDEANFIGYLACLGSEDADYRYSGYLLGWIYAGNVLAKRDYVAYNKIHAMLSEPILADLNENSAFWNQYEGEVAEVQEKVNDAYLKANGQVEGVKTYGRVVDLMLIDFVVNHWEN